MMRGVSAAGLLVALLLHACATPVEAPEPSPAAPVARAPEPAAPTSAVEPRAAPSLRIEDILGAQPRLDATSPARLSGWMQEDHLAALRAYQAGCGVSRAVADQAMCNRARLLGAVDASLARRFFEDNFTVQPVPGTGVLTAYFAPVYEARDQRGGEFTMPVRPQPADLRPGQTYADRTTIENRPARDALAWMRAEDLFFLQIQGSGVLTYPDGRRLKAVFAAHNSRPFSGIANPMRQRGLLAADNTSGDAIRGWLADNRGPRAEEIMRINPRYVFFRLEPDDGLDPVGAANIPLPAGHAIAVDPRFHTYGQAYWIDGVAPILTGAFPTYQRLVMALDTGGAIQGEVRADLYLGKGDAAGREAGRVRHDLRMYRLVPRGD